MVLWWNNSKKEVGQLRDDVKKGFEHVKKDISSVSGWIKHLDSERGVQEREIRDIKEELSSIHAEIEGLKNMVSMLGNLRPNGGFKTPRQVSNRQTGVEVVEMGVETAVETPKLESFSVTERALLWILLNTDMKLSYEDLAAMLGKERSTIRSQINSIKQKSEGLLKESVEKNGKKRVYIEEEMKEKMLKKSKVRVKDKKKGRKKVNYE